MPTRVAEIALAEPIQGTYFLTVPKRSCFLEELFEEKSKVEPTSHKNNMY